MVSHADVIFCCAFTENWVRCALSIMAELIRPSFRTTFASQRCQRPPSTRNTPSDKQGQLTDMRKVINSPEHDLSIFLEILELPAGFASEPCQVS
jgi:hypothetical protein